MGLHLNYDELNKEIQIYVNEELKLSTIDLDFVKAMGFKFEYRSIRRTKEEIMKDLVEKEFKFGDGNCILVQHANGEYGYMLNMSYCALDAKYYTLESIKMVVEELNELISRQFTGGKLCFRARKVLGSSAMDNKRLEEANIIVRNFRANNYLTTKRFQNEYNMAKMKLGVFIIMLFVCVVSIVYGIMKDNMDLVFYTCIGFILLQLIFDKFSYTQMRRFKKYKEDLRYENNKVDE